MITYLKYLFIILTALPFIACESDELPGDYKVPGPNDEVIEICLVERACFTDPFYLDIVDGFSTDRLALLKAYLEALDVDVFGIQLRQNFFEGVCEACHVCPSGDVFSIRTNQQAREVLLSRGLWLTDCLKEKDEVKLDYHATKCADPWVSYLSPQQPGMPTDEEISIAIIRYFAERDVDLLEISFYSLVGEDCEACQCLDEFGIQIRLFESDRAIAEEAGFE